MGFFDRVGRELGKIGSGLGSIITGTVGGVVDLGRGALEAAIPAALGGLQVGLSDRVAVAVGGGSRRAATTVLNAGGGGALPIQSFQTPRVGFEGGGPMAFALPGGAPIQRASFAGIAGPIIRQIPGILGGLAAGEAIEGILSDDQGNVVMGGGQCIVPRPTAPRMPSIVRLTHPHTGRDVWYRNAGRPILWSGDFAASRRVARVAGRARRRSRGRR